MGGTVSSAFDLFAFRFDALSSAVKILLGYRKSSIFGEPLRRAIGIIPSTAKCNGNLHLKKAERWEKRTINYGAATSSQAVGHALKRSTWGNFARIQ
jgi:hypothetical protein